MAQRPLLLIVSKEDASFEALRICLSDPGLTLSANSAEQGQKILEEREAPVMLLECDCPGNLEALVSAALLHDSDAQVLLAANAQEQSLPTRLIRLLPS